MFASATSSPDLFGQPTPQLEAPAFAERDITPRAPTPEIETDQILQARRTADAEYDQAFQDLVKAEQLGESDVEIQARQKALQEAEVFKKNAEARLQEIRETIEGNRQLETERKRNAVLDSVLA